MYDVKSMNADDFINDEEILATLEYADQNKNNRELIEQRKANEKELGVVAVSAGDGIDEVLEVNVFYAAQHHYANQD